MVPEVRPIQAEQAESLSRFFSCLAKNAIFLGGESQGRDDVARARQEHIIWERWESEFHCQRGSAFARLADANDANDASDANDANDANDASQRRQRRQ